MKAAILDKPQGDVLIEDIPAPKPRAGEVLIKVAACGVCHSDLHVIKGEIAFPLPCVLGHEVSGVVVEAAPDVTNVAVGDRVVGTFIMACGFCRYCIRGRDDLCETFFAMNRGKGVYYDGDTRLHRNDGSFLAMYSMSALAEYAVIPSTAVFRLPDNVPLHEASILGCALPTAFGAVRHAAEIEPGMTVAVIGVGGVGSNIVQVAKAFGAAEVIAVDIRDEALEGAQQLGATQGVNASKDDAATKLRELTGGRGVDVAFEALGRTETVLAAFNGVRDGGRVVIVGLAPGAEAAPIEITRLVRRSISLRGSYGARMRSDLPDLLDLVARGRIGVAELVSRRFSLDEASAAYAALDRREITGRAIIVIDPAAK